MTLADISILDFVRAIDGCTEVVSEKELSNLKYEMPDIDLKNLKLLAKLQACDLLILANDKDYAAKNDYNRLLGQLNKVKTTNETNEAQMWKTIPLISKNMGFSIDPTKTSAKLYYSYVKSITNGRK